MFLSDEAYSFVWLIFAGICFASFYAYFTKHFLGSLVRKLVSSGAFSEEASRTLKELGYSPFSCFILKRCLYDGSALRKYVSAIFPDKKSYTDDMLFKSAENEQKYYIPEENISVATMRFDDKGTSLVTVMITIVLFFFAALIVTGILPVFEGIFGSDDDNGVQSEQSVQENIPVQDDTPENNPVNVQDEEFSMLTPGNTSAETDNNGDNAIENAPDNPAAPQTNLGN